ncbi:MAG: hypothetical protein AB9897_00340 [Anaerolineaceae bacterium]
MNQTRSGSLIAGIGLVLLGALFICINLVSGFVLVKTWPLVFFVIAFAFFLPGLAWPESRKGLAALFIPGTITFVLGAIFLFNTLTNYWAVWAYAWILIPASVGLGLLLAAWIGKWDRGVFLVGIWIALISLAVFAVFAALFGNLALKFIGAGVLVLMGIAMLIRSFVKKPTV